MDEVPDPIDLAASICFWREDSKNSSREYEDLTKPQFLSGHPNLSRKEFLDFPFQIIENQLVYGEIQKRKNNHE